MCKVTSLAHTPGCKRPLRVTRTDSGTRSHTLPVAITALKRRASELQARYVEATLAGLRQEDRSELKRVATDPFLLYFSGMLYEWGGEARLLMQWATAPVCAPDQPDWYGRYYNGTSLQESNFRFDRNDASPNFDWGGGRPSNGSTSVGGNDTFSVKWIRTQNFAEPGVYRFTVGSDDGTRLYVNGTRVINNWNNQPYVQGIRTADVEIEQELSRPYAYVAKSSEASLGLSDVATVGPVTTGIDIISLKDLTQLRAISAT